jgi:hypothetical protein
LHYSNVMQTGTPPPASGGSAAAGGVGFEHRVGAWVASLVLAEADASPPWILPGQVWLKDFRCQAPAEVDDLLVGTTAGGFAFLQIKKRLRLEDSPTSRLAGALTQLVSQFLAFQDQPGTRPWERPLEPDRDRLVIVVDSDSSASIREHLPEVLRRLSDGIPEDDCGTNEDERRAWTVARAHIHRAWEAATGKAPGPHELRAFAALTRIQTLALDDGGSDQLAAEAALRKLLAHPDEARAAWRTLCQHCQHLAERRSGSDRPGLAAAIADAGLRLNAPRSYRPSIERLREYSEKVLEGLTARTEIRLGTERIQIRRPLVGPLSSMAESGSLVVTGQPGAGKSATIVELAREFKVRGRDVVVLAVDRLSGPDLHRAVGLEHPHSLPDVLKNWPDPEPGFVLIDGLDAAREPALVTALNQLIAEILADPGRWRVVLSIRTFDLRWSEEIQERFRGAPHDVYRNPDVFRVRHFNVPELRDEELQQIKSQSPRLAAAIESAWSSLAGLLAVPFNLWLLARLIESDVPAEDLRQVHTQIQLLDLFWRSRVGTPSTERSSNELLLHRVCTTMVAERRLRAAVASVATPADGPVLDRVRSAGVLVPWRSHAAGQPQDQFVEFAHNILFDFAVQRLILTTDVDTMSGHIRRDPDLLLIVRPSFVMVMHALWQEDPTRTRFWDAVFRLAESADVPEIAKLLGPAVAAERAKQLPELDSLCTGLEAESSGRREAALTCLRHLVSALVAGLGGPLVGPNAGPWTAFAARLARIGRGDVIYPARVLLNELSRAV